MRNLNKRGAVALLAVLLTVAVEQLAGGAHSVVVHEFL